MAGVSEEQVRNALNLNQKFTQLPILRQQLVKGEVSVNKLIRIASVATIDTEKFWADQVKKLPQKALEVLVKDEKNSQLELRAQPVSTENFQDVKLPADVAQELLELQRRGLNLGDLLRQFLAQRREQIATQKSQFSAATSSTNSRYIPQKVRNIISEEYSSKCSIPNCNRPSKNLHHTQRFALAHRHDPQFIAPLCREHHQIAHSVDQYFWERRKDSQIQRQ